MTVLKSVRHKYTGAVGVQSQQGTSRRLMIVLVIATLMAITAALWTLIQANAPQRQSPVSVPLPAPTMQPIDHCQILTQEAHYLAWRKSAQIVLYGQEIDEPYYQPMWYMIEASPHCNIDLTIINPSGFHLDGIELDMSPPLNYDKFLTWKQTLANHTNTPAYLEGGK